MEGGGAALRSMLMQALKTLLLPAMPLLKMLLGSSLEAQAVKVEALMQSVRMLLMKHGVRKVLLRSGLGWIAMGVCFLQVPLALVEALGIPNIQSAPNSLGTTT